MKAAGYVQEEYLLSGTANVYDRRPDGSLQVKTACLPYTTRLVLVRHKDKRRFNGIVQLGFTHPENPDWRHFSFCLFAGPLQKVADGWETSHAVSIRPGKIDRSPTGTAVSARLAILAARGQIGPGQVLRARSLIGGQFEGRIVGAAKVGHLDAILPEISGRAWITGTHQHMLDPADPWPEGYRLSDTWGAR